MPFYPKLFHNFFTNFVDNFLPLILTLFWERIFTFPAGLTSPSFNPLHPPRELFEDGIPATDCKEKIAQRIPEDAPSHRYERFSLRPLERQFPESFPP
jgi:hypothetical protein